MTDFMEIPESPPAKYSPDIFAYTNKEGLKEVIDLKTGKLLMVQEHKGGPLVSAKRPGNHMFDQDRADLIIQKICEGEPMCTAALFAGVSMTTLMHWRAREPDFEGALQMAIKARAEIIRDKIVDEIRYDIGKDDAAGKRVKIDALKWLASCDDKQRFGTSKSEVTVQGAGVLIVDTGIRREGDEGFQRVSEKDILIGGDNGRVDGGAVGKDPGASSDT